VGVVCALIVLHLIAGLFYGVSASDPLTFISLMVVLVIVVLAGCYIPARCPMRVDPIAALREA
jgi:putative ABC transport system permease protein